MVINFTHKSSNKTIKPPLDFAILKIRQSNAKLEEQKKIDQKIRKEILLLYLKFIELSDSKDKNVSHNQQKRKLDMFIHKQCQFFQPNQKGSFSMIQTIKIETKRTEQ